MKLAEALQLRADLQRRIEQLEYRLNNNAIVQEGETPAEDPIALLCEYDSCIIELEAYITKINNTNTLTEVDGVTLSALLSKRDCLKTKVSAYRGFLNEASNIRSRISRTEIKLVSTVNVADFQKRVDKMSKELRDLDLRIQELNWTTELL